MNENTGPKLQLEAKPNLPFQGDTVALTASVTKPDRNSGEYKYTWKLESDTGVPDQAASLFKLEGKEKNYYKQFLDTTELLPDTYTVKVDATPKTGKKLQATLAITVQQAPLAAMAHQFRQDSIGIATRQTSPTDDQGLWVKLRQCLEGRRFEMYDSLVTEIMCGNSYEPPGERLDSCNYRHGVQGYQLLKAATETFLLCHACCGNFDTIGDNFSSREESPRLGHSATQEDMQNYLNQYLSSSASPQTLPYLGQILKNLDLLGLESTNYPCSQSVRGQPCMFELIWSYWQEQGGLVQTINAITLRFQNRRVHPGSVIDPLANLALDPLRPLNNLLWGYVQDSRQRLTVARRAYEYEHEYGLLTEGKAVGKIHPAERRGQFLESFHALLQAAAVWYRDLQNTMVNPDPFPILEKIRTVHLQLAKGANNQFGELSSTARMEMMMAQWLIAQPPMREFLHSRAMVPYAEPWMGQVDAMHKLMSWSDVSVSYFDLLARFGEMILLSIRYGNWTQASNPQQANNWLQYWRPEIQGYIEAYRTVTGVDLSASSGQRTSVNAMQPSKLLQRRSQRNTV
ncbi:hypothetical protein [Microbulbifer discodermiae]|uniref:hypothetical protein n=1 Tax=Microbulbifer sp. 2201CG32-9 TaxID=3232309 RepID=UPI00345C48BE